MSNKVVTPLYKKLLRSHLLKFGLSLVLLTVNLALILGFFDPEPAMPLLRVSDQDKAKVAASSDAEVRFYPIFAPGTPPEVIEQFYKNFPEHRANRDGGSNNFTFADGNRWATTATNGGGLTQGDPTTLTWGFVPDGTAVDGLNGEPSAPSNLIAFLDGIYGGGPGDLTQRPWFPVFQQIFDSWANLTGITYIYEPNDDGAALIFPLPSGSLGVRADIRISGHPIDGNANVLAYNFFPDNGDMVIDTADNFYNDTANNSLGLRNVLAHEHGHGLGISHVCPTNETKLMEPFVTFAFDGPQPDDILAANRGYGDRFEPNDTSGAAHSLGALPNGTRAVTDTISLDDNSDIDFFSFTITQTKRLSLTVSPAGSAYLSGPQTIACNTGATFNALAQNDLAVDILDTDGSTIMASLNDTGPGESETVNKIDLPNAGTYFIKVSGPFNKAQLYTMSLEIEAVPNVGITKSVTPATLTPGEPLTYTLTYSNGGGATATGIVITDIVPITLTNVVSASSGATLTATGSSNFTWQVANLEPNEGGTIILSGIISPALESDITFTNTVTITSTGDFNAANNQAAVPVMVTIPSPDVKVYLPLVIKR